ncbi:MAG: NlpC/P60 family protein [Elainellaceae cyanobacterium]
MVSISELHASLSIDPTTEYQCYGTIDLFDSPELERLATQAVAGRQLRILSLPLTIGGTIGDRAILISLCEDGYPAWMPLECVDLIEVSELPYRAVTLSESQLRDRLLGAIAYAMAAMKHPNRYLWGGTVGPNYDCSGLVQTAFASAGVWLPRDSYQQEAFTSPISQHDLQPGDLVFFGTPQRTTHVGIHLGEQRYIHSSGRDQGRNGIAIDILSEHADTVSAAYYRQFRRGGRILKSYHPQPCQYSNKL